MRSTIELCSSLLHAPRAMGSSTLRASAKRPLSMSSARARCTR